MGANFNTYRIKAATKVEAIERAHAHQRAMQHEYGHGAYTGHLGTRGIEVTVSLKTYENFDDAENDIVDTHGKWDPPILAAIKGKDGESGWWLLAGWCPS